MPRISYLPDNRVVETDTETSILHTSLQAGIPHTHVCGVNARCSTCRVVILQGLEFCCPRNEKEEALTRRLHFGPTIRLACQTRISGDVKLRRLVLDDQDIEVTSQLGRGSIPSTVGQEKQVAIMFADIRGFASFAESLLPYDVIHVLNRYFDQMGRVISHRGGYIDNYMGDGLLALFGVDDAADASLRSVRAGVEMLNSMEGLNAYLGNLCGKHIGIGIGIHFGEVVIGSIGTSDRRRETVIGDAVNFASRIEAANKEVETELLISEDVYQQVRDQVQIGKRAKITVRGKSGEHTIYEVVGAREIGA